MRPINTWLPPTVGLLTSATIAVLATAPPGHPYTWPRLIAASVFIVLETSLTCATTMFLLYVVLPPKPGVGPIIRRMAAIAACFGPLVILLQQSSLLAPLVAAFIVWTLSPTQVTPQPDWKKFIGALSASALLQVGIAAAMDKKFLISAFTLGLATAPFAWRIRQERTIRGPFKPRSTILIALLLAIVALTHYLPIRLGSATSAYEQPAPPGPSRGGKYRGVILIPEVEQQITLVVPLPMMSRDPFRAHKDPIGIPFYGVYWFFQSPDRAPADDAYKTKGAPDDVSFHSADMSPLKMEARQNLGRLIDVSACSGIDVAIRNADSYSGLITIEVLIADTSQMPHPSQSLGRAAIKSRPPAKETLSFKMPPASAIQQFDELTIRFHRASYTANRSAKIAIERFFLVPRGR
jgi:hypothetical protein